MAENQLHVDPFAATLLRAMPLAVAVLGPDLAIVALNSAAEKVFGAAAVEAVGERPGNAFCCVNAAATAAGCGDGVNCGDCLLRRAGLAAIAGQTLDQQELTLRIRRQGGSEEKYVLLSASPFHFAGRDLAVVLLQDVTPLHRLRGIVPICAACKKVRRDDRAWEAVEAFVSDHSHALFSHGICPDCCRRLYPELEVSREPR